MRYIIVGTGPSIKQLTVPLPKRKDIKIIVINSAVRIFNYYHIWFSLDPSMDNINYAKIALNKGAECYMALSDSSFRRPDRRVKLLNRISSNKPIPKNPQTPEEWFDRWSCIPTLSERSDTIHTGNSLYGALQLAYFTRPEKILLLGLDGTSEKSVGGNHYPNNLSHLPLLFQSSVKQLNKNGIKLVNGSPNSIVRCFKRMTPNEGVNWLVE